MTESEQKKRLGENIKAKMRERGMTQRELAKRACVSPAAISQYVHGKRDIGAASLSRIANELGCTWDELFEGVL